MWFAKLGGGHFGDDESNDHDDDTFCPPSSEGVSPFGPVPVSSMTPEGLTVDAGGNLFVADQSNAVVEKITPSGTLSIVAGNGTSSPATPGPATSSSLVYPSGVAVDALGNLSIADLYGGSQYCGEVDRVTPDGTLSILAGTGACGGAIAGPADSTPVFVPASLAINQTGNLEVSTFEQIVTIDLGSSPRNPQIKALRPTANGLRVRWTAPTSLIGTVTSYVATAANGNGDVVGSCTARGGDRICVITGLPSTGHVNVSVKVNENHVPHALSGIVSFTSASAGVTLG